ncbi:hypothetical protein [Tissierella sp. Yu-01]|uniref:hypothetical protein n=1 Tax=Tissierella sp. Yu-01 TaxID=3035694 RepID=UPI00240E76BC|nr:hypothetical protein [Tissierella sp. Yu-01]WFA09331.1 hypothetical protein P3962_01790 [Tissierella sp. Yu-01]
MNINMKKKLMLLTIAIAMGASIMTGCTSKAPATEPEKTEATETIETPEEENSDAVSSASVVSDEESFEKGISEDGTFIVLTTKDLTFENDLVVDGTFTKEDKEGNKVITRSLAFAQNDADGNMERYSVTVPNIVINSENTLLEYGTIKGDVYVQAPGFNTKDATIEGNLYFATQELMDAFSIDELTNITGETAVKEYTK